MLRKTTLLLFSIFLIWQVTYPQTQQTGKIKVVNFDQLEPYLHKSTDTLYLVNFWATWCAPCLKELPAIKQVEEKYANRKFKVLLISLDMRKDLTTRLEPFVQSRNISAEVILLSDPDQNRWIDLVDPSWSGELPFTLIYNKQSRESYSHVFTFEELDSIINLKLNSQ